MSSSILEMDIAKAKAILGDKVQPDGALFDLKKYIRWNPGDKGVCIDAIMSPEELVAIAWWVASGPHASQ